MEVVLEDNMLDRFATWGQESFSQNRNALIQTLLQQIYALPPLFALRRFNFQAFIGGAQCKLASDLISGFR
ncbi:MAG: hypothetical protein AUJ51_08545 [Elusimicrobia bacterium CG1_02_56_21]|nr:MAG: hypothetical protein AUJ51_08545 [Elusimicrobia bacterium CG1_02_56_21]